MTTDGGEAKAAPFHAGGEDSPHGPKRPWVVLVEDNPGDVRLVREAFYECGLHYNLTVLADGERAMQLIDRLESETMACPNLMLLDIGLPKNGGFEILQRIRASPRFPQLPVVILTSSDAQRDRERAAQLGVTKYIRKPGSLDDFIRLGLVFRTILTGRNGP